MSYPIETRPASKNGYFTPAEAKAYYGRYSRDGVTIHWWNTPELAGTHDQTVNYILGQAQAGNMSVNYVVSDSKITLCVNPDNVSWHATKGNPTTIGIEFDPRLNTEGYRKGGWLIQQLEERYGKHLPLYPHKHWASTSCPGTIDINRLRAEADKWHSSNKPALPTQGGQKPVDKNDLDHIYQYGPLSRPRGAGEGEDVYLGKTAAFVLADHARSTELKTRREQEATARAQSAAEADQAKQDRINELQAKVNELTAQIQKGGNVDPAVKDKADRFDKIKSALS